MQRVDIYKNISNPILKIYLLERSKQFFASISLHNVVVNMYMYFILTYLSKPVFSDITMNKMICLHKAQANLIRKIDF